MPLTTLVKQATKINDAIKIADETFNDRDLWRLMSRRDALNSMASHLRPRSRAEAVFLCDRIKEYADFVADEPASPRDRDEALEAIARMATNLRKRKAA